MLQKVSSRRWLIVGVLASFLLFVVAVVPSSTSFAQNGSFSTTAQSAIVVEQNSGRVMFAHNEHKQLPMASTTKILTAITVIDNCDLNKLVSVPKQACGVEGSSVYLKEGEHITVRELLYGLMLRSGNDCAVALALTVSNSLTDFATLMNQKAKQLGCTESNFVTPHGLHDDNHYTTASDLAKITCYALNNEDFCQIVGSKSVKIRNELGEYDRVLINKNKLLKSLNDATGVKTGYTKKAGRCFVGSAKRNGMHVVAVVLNCAPMFEECQQMLNFAFAKYKQTRIIPQGKVFQSRLENGKRAFYYCPKAFCYPLLVGETPKIVVDMKSNTPSVTVTLNGRTIFCQRLNKISTK